MVRLVRTLGLMAIKNASSQTSFFFAFSLVALIFGTGRGHGADPLPVDYAWQQEPKLDFDWWLKEPQLALQVSVQRIASPLAIERLSAAQTILRLSDHSALDGPALLEALLTRLEQGEPQPYVRKEMVAAACALDDGTSAERLWSVVHDDFFTRPILERACIRWGQAQPLELWRDQLRSFESGTHERARALQGIAAVGSASDLPSLIAIATDGIASPVDRLAAAEAIGRLSTTDQLPLAQQLRDSSASLGDLMSISVLGDQADRSHQDFVAAVAEEGEIVAQRRAYAWMCRLDKERALSKATAYIMHRDPVIRELSVQQLVESDADDTLGILAQALHDKHPDVRNTTRALLLARAALSTEQQQLISSIVAETIQRQDWRSLEQALRLTVDMHLSEHVPRLLELLEHNQSEVSITAAWALRHLATEEVHLQAMLEHAQILMHIQNGDTQPTDPIDESDLRRVAHLLEALGMRRFEPAQEMLLKYVPKDNQKMGLITRMAGMWGCGKMWEGQENRKLADELCARIADKSALFGEPESIRYAAMIALGWLADPATLDSIRAYGEPLPTPIGHATAWAVSRVEER